ncbi:beta strand repeat-containing protein, partial [Flavobacterium sp.]|uniref:beta strand repeat-containing protein n=1 Tax=Flavobacterium sp. TaxID=239 RepID=UPI00378EDAA3
MIPFLPKRIRYILVFATMIFSFGANAQDLIYWSGSSANGNWDWGNGCSANAGGNWYWSSSGIGNRSRPDCFGVYNVINFDNNANSTMNLNSLSDFSANQMLFINGTPDRTINTDSSRSIYFQNNNGNCKIENYVVGTTHTFNVPIFVNSGGNNMEINPVNGYLSFTSTITNNSSNTINVYGNQQLTFSGDITGSPGVTINGAATVVYSGASKTYLGSTTINAGATLKISSNQTLGNIVLNGGTLQVAAGVILTITGAYTATGGNISNLGTIKFAGGSVIFPSLATVNNGSVNTLTGFEVAPLATVILSSSLNVDGLFTVSTGGILDFNGFNILGAGAFTLANSGTLKITSADGVNAMGNNTGNIQTTGARIFSQSGYYNYIGNATPQSTGTAMTSGSAAKQIIINKTNATDVVNLTQSTGISNSGGQLSIIKGVFVETSTANIYGSGNISMTVDATYKTSVLSPTVVPQLSGTFSLSGGTINLNASGNQILNGNQSYYNINFSNSGTKTLSAPISTIAGTVTIQDAAILDAANHTFGGVNTNITMTGTSKYMLYGTTASKPESKGTYSLGPNTTFEFTGTSATNIRLSAPIINYANIVVSGTNVSNPGITTGLKFQSGGTFTVKNGATFKLLNSNGFTGAANTAIDNTNSPTVTLEAGSTIEYAGGDQVITLAPTTTAYSNLTVSGAGTKTIPTAELFIGNNLNVNASTLKIESGKTIRVTNAVTIDPAATMTFESNNSSQSGSLVQTNDIDTNSGVIVYLRIVPVIRSTDYTYWSSPVFNQNLQLFSPNTPANKFYSFNTAVFPEDWKQEIPSSTAMSAGVGYCIYGAQLTLPPTFFSASFIGKPNNGIIDVPIKWNGAIDGTSNLIGNPYPSAIDANSFLSANAGVIEGTIYFWTHNTDLQLATNISAGNAGSGTYAYTKDDYAEYNFTGGVAAGKKSISSGANTAIPNGKIAAGQAFFTTSLLANGVVEFKNYMRISGGASGVNNSQFFKNTNSKSKLTNTVEKNRIWLDISNDQGAFKQLLVGYITDATNGYD